MVYYYQNDKVFTVIGSANRVHSELPVGTYVVKFDMMKGFFLEEVENMSLPSKIYGKLDNRDTRSLKTIQNRTSNLGILLYGEKGSGKTLYVKRMSEEMRKIGIPTILVNTDHHGEDYNTFIASIQCECLIVFDEFEKIYNNQSQNSILTLLDGTINTKKMFILTCNTRRSVNEYMINRPGRIHYAYEYKGLDEHFVREYCQDRLNDKSSIETIVNACTASGNINFDMLKAIIDEMNEYNESLAEVLQHLNIDFDNNDNIDKQYVVKQFIPHDEYLGSFVKKVTGDIDRWADFRPMTSNYNLRIGFNVDNAPVSILDNLNRFFDEISNDTEVNDSYFYDMELTPDMIYKIEKNGNIYYRNNKATLVLEIKKPTKSDFLSLLV